MKKFLTLSISILAMLVMYAGNPGAHQVHKSFPSPNSPTPPRVLTHASGSRAITCDTLELDYGLYDSVYTSNAGRNYNGSFSTGLYIDEVTSMADTAHAYANTYISQVFDSLAYVDANWNLASFPRATITVKLLALGMAMNINGDTALMHNDSLVFTIYKMVGNTPTAVQTIVRSGVAQLMPFITLPGYYTYAQIAVNQQFAMGEGFKIRLDYKGKDASSHCGFGFSWADSCGAANAYAYPSPFVTNAAGSFIIPIGGANVQLFPYNNTQLLTLTGYPENCRRVPEQNWAFYPIIQVCQDLGGGPCTIDQSVTAGISPTSENVPCIDRGVSASQNYTFVVPAQVTSMHIDSIVNLPAGFTYTLDQNPPTYAGGSKGCILSTGTTTSPCGQYKVLIYATIVVPIIGTLQGELSVLGAQFGFKSPFLRVKDVAGTCPAVDSTQTVNFVADPTCGIAVVITASISSSTNVSCFGGSDGAATVTASGGSNYTYAWSNIAQTTATVTGLAAGTYTVTVTSGTSTATATVSISQPVSAVSASTSTTQSSCTSATGSAAVTPAGGTPNYTVMWNNNQTTDTISNIGAGSYSVTVTDSKGCSVTASASVTTATGPSATFTTTDVLCHGASTGGVNVSVSGGTGTISYSWSNSATSQDLTNVAAGTYSLTVTDANSCVYSVTATVGQPATALSVSATSTPSSGSNGTATASATGGTTPYTGYSWSNTQTGAAISGLAPGTYTVTATDANACTATASVTVLVTGITEAINEITNFSLFPNPANDKLNVVMDLKNVRSVQLNVTDITGKVIYSSKETASGKLNHEIKVSEFATGTYIIEVIADKQTVRKTFNVTR